MDHLPTLLSELMDGLTQTEESGGVNNPPELRLFLLSLAMLLRAQRVVETGYDAGRTTLALALSGADVCGVDDLSEYRDVEVSARELLAGFGNVQMVRADALVRLSEGAT
jgi:hypothetical protein